MNKWEDGGGSDPALVWRQGCGLHTRDHNVAVLECGFYGQNQHCGTSRATGRGTPDGELAAALGLTEWAAFERRTGDETDALQLVQHSDAGG